MKIGVYDSGLGGMFVFRYLVESNPDNEYYYLGDQINAPYGEKTNEELTRIIEKNLKWFSKQGVEKVIIACNTICSLGFEHVDNQGIELFGIIVPTVEQIDYNTYRNVLVLGTRLSIENHGYKKRMSKFENVYELALPNLVSLIENDRPDTEVKKYLEECFKEINYNYDAVILGCTHYPAVQNIIEDLLDSKIFNSNELDFDFSKSDKSSIKIYTTADPINMKKQVKELLNYDCNPERVVIG